MEINCDELIDLVQQRRGLYDLSTHQYSDKNAKMKLWEEVYSHMIDGWHTLDVKEKTIKGKEIQRRWNSLRDCFRRELALQKKTPSGSAAKKRRKYMYFDQLLFLLPHTKERTESFLDNNGIADGFQSQQTQVLNNTEDSLDAEKIHDEIIDQSTLPPIPQTSNTDNHRVKGRKPNIENHNSEVLKEENLIMSQNKRSAPDDDVSFLMSLLPFVKKYNDTKRIMLRMELLNTILIFDQRVNGANDVGNMHSSSSNHSGSNYDSSPCNTIWAYLHQSAKSQQPGLQVNSWNSQSMCTTLPSSETAACDSETYITPHQDVTSLENSYSDESS